MPKLTFLFWLFWQIEIPCSVATSRYRLASLCSLSATSLPFITSILTPWAQLLEAQPEEGLLIQNVPVMRRER
jgi:hypothetical protein